MAKPKRKTFNLGMQLFVQGSVLVTEIVAGWLATRYSPDFAESMKPHIGELLGVVHGFVLAWSAAKIKVKNVIRENESV